MMQVQVLPQTLAPMDPPVGLQPWQLPSNVCLSPLFPYPHPSACFSFTSLLLHKRQTRRALFWYNVCVSFVIPRVVTEYNSDLSCHYKVELSYENLVTSGPDPHPPPIADDESDDEDDDDVPRVSAASTLHTSHLLIMTSNLILNFLLFIVYVYLCLTLGGSLCLAGKGLGDQSVPDHS